MANKNEFEEFVDSLKGSSLEDRLRALYLRQIPTFVAGPPGCAKSSIITKIIRECDWHREERPSQWDPIDARGVPIVRRKLNELNEKMSFLKARLQIAQSTKNDTMVRETGEQIMSLIKIGDQLLQNEGTSMIEWPHLDFLPPEGFTGSVALFFDELNTAPPAVQNVLLQPFQATQGDPRRIGPHTIYGDHIWLVAAGNRPEDIAHVNPMGGPLRNRFHIIEVNIDKTFLQNWTLWATQNNIHPHVVGFLNFRMESLYQKPQKDFDAFPTPRSWSEQVSPLLHDGIQGVTAFTGAVGRGAATEFMSYVEELQFMPDLQKLLAGKLDFDFEKAPLSITYATMVEMVFRCKDDYKMLEPAMNVANMVRPEYAAIFVSSVMRGEPELQAKAIVTPNIRKWAQRNQALIRPEA